MLYLLLLHCMLLSVVPTRMKFVLLLKFYEISRKKLFNARRIEYLFPFNFVDCLFVYLLEFFSINLF